MAQGAVPASEATDVLVRTGATLDAVEVAGAVVPHTPLQTSAGVPDGAVVATTTGSESHSAARH